jgi:hypothetical protein
MNNDALTLLNIRRLPGRLTVPQAAVLLGFSEHDIPILIRKGLLKPLGNPVPNAVKYFAKTEVEEHAANPNWLSDATKTVSRHWAKRNSARDSDLTKAAATLN